MSATAGSSTAGIELAPGETLVPDSVEMAAPASDVPEATSAAKEAAESASDAPPAPTPDADTNI